MPAGPAPMITMSNICFSVYGKVSYAERFLYSCFIEPYYNFAVYIQHRHAHLSRLIYHLMGFLLVGGNVYILEYDIIILQELFRPYAKGARRRTIYLYGFCHVSPHWSGTPS